MTLSPQRVSRGLTKSGQTQTTQETAAREARTDPRANQRDRTRTAIMEATRALLRQGKVPSIADAAHHARVSRATAYRYFPTQGALIQEAIKSGLVPAEEWEEQLAGSDELPERVERLAVTMLGLVRENEALLRGAMLLSLQQWVKTHTGEELGEEPIKRGGRLEGIDVALEPFQTELDSRARRRLAIAVSLFLGIEARIVMHDIWNLDETEAEQVTVWATRMLARAATEDNGLNHLPQE